MSKNRYREIGGNQFFNPSQQTLPPTESGLERLRREQARKEQLRQKEAEYKKRQESVEKA